MSKEKVEFLIAVIISLSLLWMVFGGGGPKH